MSHLRLQQVDIKKYLPHRKDSLYLQQAEIENLSATGLAEWRIGHPVIVGHFPGLPIVPGICLIEAAAQLAGLIIACQKNFLGEIGVLAGIKKALLKKPVLPNQLVKLMVKIKDKTEKFYLVTGSAAVAGTQVATFDLILSSLHKNAMQER